MLTFLIACFIVTVVIEFANFSVYGWIVDDKVVDDYINEYKVFSKNPFNHDIISPSVRDNTFEESVKILMDDRYISKISLSLLFKYQVKGVGLVPVWSDTHKKIKELYKNSKIDKYDFKSN